MEKENSVKICEENRHLHNDNPEELYKDTEGSLSTLPITTNIKDTREGNSGDTSSDDDETLSDITETGEDVEKVAEDMILNSPLGDNENDSNTDKSCNDLSIEQLEGISENDKSRSTHEGSPVFYLEPGDWEKPDYNPTMERNSFSPLPQFFNAQGEKRCSSVKHSSLLKSSKSQRVPSPLCFSPPRGTLSALRKPIIQQSRRLPSPQTLYNPLISRLHQSESMQTLPECNSYQFSDTKTSERVRSYSSSSNRPSCHNLYRQSFGSGSYSGTLSPLSISGNLFFTSPVKRGSIINDSMTIPTIGNANGQNLLRREEFPVQNIVNNIGGIQNRNSTNSVRHRKTAIPLLCSRAAVMVRKLDIFTTNKRCNVLL